jgi:hypothetical protein
LLIFQKYGIFLIKKIGDFKKMLTRQEAIERIKAGLLHLPPLLIKLAEPRPSLADNREVDAVLEVAWQDNIYHFGFEYKTRSTPKEFQSALDQTLHVSKVIGLLPMVLMPFLSEKQLLELAERQISGLDFSGNGVVIVPGQLYVFRNGSRNQFPASETIQNIYRKNASIVARAFLIRPTFDSVNSIEAFIQLRGGQIAAISLSTVSKALKVLEDDLIVSREKNSIRLIQPEKLLDKLAANFTRPLIRRFLVGKSPYDTEVLMRLLSESSLKHQVWLTGTGVGSTAQYAVMAQENFLSVYCTDQYRLLTGVEFKETNRFPNLEIIETQDKTVHFDSRQRNGFAWASPIQTYLELMAGDQRNQDTAAQVKKNILADVTRQLA